MLNLDLQESEMLKPSQTSGLVRRVPRGRISANRMKCVGLASTVQEVHEAPFAQDLASGDKWKRSMQLDSQHSDGLPG